MDQKQWKKNVDPNEIIDYLIKKGLASNKDLRIFAANCLNAIRIPWSVHLRIMVLRELIDYAEGKISDENFAQFLSPIKLQPYNNYDRITASTLSMDHEWWKTFIGRISNQVSPKTQCKILRDMFNPFEQQTCLMVDENVKIIAQSSFSPKHLKLIADRDHVLILSDALIEIGYNENEPIVKHLRNVEKHYYNCWAIKCLIKGE